MTNTLPASWSPWGMPRGPSGVLCGAKKPFLRVFRLFWYSKLTFWPLLSAFWFNYWAFWCLSCVSSSSSEDSASSSGGSSGFLGFNGVSASASGSSDGFYGFSDASGRVKLCSKQYPSCSSSSVGPSGQLSIDEDDFENPANDAALHYYLEEGLSLTFTSSQDDSSLIDLVCNVGLCIAKFWTAH